MKGIHMTALPAEHVVVVEPSVRQMVNKFGITVSISNCGLV
jgi:hypothetical protein